MSGTVILAVLFAACLHASWNALVKNSSSKEISMSAVVLGHIPPALLALLFCPWPNRVAMVWLIAGALLHTVYQFSLMASYRVGDFTQVYPIARGSAPVMVALITLAMGFESLTTVQIIAIVLVTCGVLSLGLVKASTGFRSPKAVLLALFTGCCIAAYSMTDGYGARLAGTALGYYSVMTCINATLFIMIISITKPGTIKATFRTSKKLLVLGGGASFVAYAIATWAFTKTPIALVMALRETSIIFALFIGLMLLGERVTLLKVCATLLTVLGAVLMRFG